MTHLWTATHPVGPATRTFRIGESFRTHDGRCIRFRRHYINLTDSFDDYLRDVEQDTLSGKPAPDYQPARVADWQTECGFGTVATKSTGVCWMLHWTLSIDDWWCG